MKIHFLTLIVFLLITSCEKQVNSTQKSTQHEAIAMTQQLRHVVLFKFKESATSASVEKVEAAFAALPSKIDVINDFEWGINNSPEDLNKGFTHCFFVSFDSEEDRAIYLPHPEHLAFVEVLKPHLDDVLVVDYWTH